VDWLSSDHVGTPTDTNATMVHQQRNGVFYVVCAGRCYNRDGLGQELSFENSVREAVKIRVSSVLEYVKKRVQLEGSCHSENT
jgi:hypothetical protein